MIFRSCMPFPRHAFKTILQNIDLNSLSTPYSFRNSTMVNSMSNRKQTLKPLYKPAMLHLDLTTGNSSLLLRIHLILATRMSTNMNAENQNQANVQQLSRRQLAQRERRERERNNPSTPNKALPIFSASNQYSLAQHSFTQRVHREKEVMQHRSVQQMNIDSVYPLTSSSTAHVIGSFPAHNGVLEEPSRRVIAQRERRDRERRNPPTSQPQAQSSTTQGFFNILTRLIWA